MLEERVHHSDSTLCLYRLEGGDHTEEQYHHAGYRRQARGQQCDRLESIE